MCPDEKFESQRSPAQDHGQEQGNETGAAGEYEDEPAGAYLAHLRLGTGALLWGIILNLMIIAMAIAGWLLDGQFSPRGEFLSESLVPLRILWQFLPILAVVGFLSCLFMRLNSVPGSLKEAFLGNMIVWLQLFALILWLAARWGAGIQFLDN